MSEPSNDHVADRRYARSTAFSLQLRHSGRIVGTVLCLTAIAADRPASACVVLTGDAAIPAEELVARSPSIVLATAESVRTFTQEHSLPGKRSVRIPKAEYTFRTLESLKGPASAEFSLVFIYPSDRAGSAPDEDFNGHRESGSRSFVPGPCEVSADFAIGKRYLIFTATPYHVSGFEQILSDDDLWLAKVRRLIGALR